MKTPYLNSCQRKAIRYLGAATRNFADLWHLAGPHNASARACILTDLLSWPKRIPQAKAGITSLTAAFHHLAGQAVLTGECQATRDDQFRDWARSLDIYRPGESGEDAARRLGYTLGDVKPTPAEFAHGDQPALARIDAENGDVAKTPAYLAIASQVAAQSIGDVAKTTGQKTFDFRL